MDFLTAIVIGLLFTIGVYQILRRNMIRAAIGLMLLSNGINLFLLSMGSVVGVDPAYVTAANTRADALPQALVLTAIVISMGGLAFMLAMLYVVSSRYKTSDVDEIKGLRY